MVAQKSQFAIHYQLPEEGFDRLQLVRDSLKLLMHCAEDSQRGAIELPLLASHLRLLVDQLDSAIEMTNWAGKGV